LEDGHSTNDAQRPGLSAVLIVRVTSAWNLSLSKDRKLMVYSKAQLCSYSWTLLHLGNFFGDYLTAWFE